MVDETPCCGWTVGDRHTDPPTLLEVGKPISVRGGMPMSVRGGMPISVGGGGMPIFKYSKMPGDDSVSPEYSTDKFG